MRAFALRSGLIVLGLFTAATAVALPPPPPVAPVKPVVNDYYGTKVTDPYRWMEGENNPQFQTWMKAQNDYTRAVLGSIPGRDAMIKAVEKADGANTAVYELQPADGKLFYFKALPGQNLATLDVREGANGNERVLIDPNKLSHDGKHYSISYYRASFDGRYVAYGLAEGGSEKSVLHVLDVKTGKQLDEAITRAEGDGGFVPVAWRPDGKSFFYYRQQELGPKDSPSAKYLKSRDYLHLLGKNPNGNGDKAVFGYGVNSDIKVGLQQDALIETSPRSSYVFALLTRNEETDVIEGLYAAPVADIGVKANPWHRIAAKADKIAGFRVHGSDIYLISHKDAPHYKVLMTSIVHPDVAKAKLIVPNSEHVVNGIYTGENHLYVRYLDNGIGHVERFAYGSDKSGSVPLAYDGTVADVVTVPGEAGAYVEMTSWTKSPLWYHFSPAQNSFTDTGWVPPSPVDFSAIESREVEAVSYDGTRIPLSIIMPRGTKLDGHNPTLLIGYGSYGITIHPGFWPAYLPWYQHGGILAIAHVRGSGVKGEDWHEAGKKLTKINTFLDMIASAHYLIDHHYTSPKYLGGRGTSAGGITIGGAITWAPHLFAAAIDNVGMSDTLRAETTPNGPPNIVEFGSVITHDGFRGLYAMSPYAHIHKGTRYPAVLGITGANDPRVAPWMVGKMVARLQAATSSGKPVMLRVDYDAGHGVGSTRTQRDEKLADQFTFLLWQFGYKDFQPR